MQTQIGTSFEVDNAIIMAAGCASRFAPLSSEKPKGLLVVRGEVMIERQIRQLQEAGIDDITVVVGYMKEQFFYLEDKCHVQIVVNEDYYCYNNTATLMTVLGRLGNTYLCSSDNYFTVNPFEKNVDHAYYAGIRGNSTDSEYYMQTDAEGRIVTVQVTQGLTLPYMIGHVCFSKEFCRQFLPILQNAYTFDPQTRLSLWEDILKDHLDICDLHLREYPADTIYEFDTLDELREFDTRYFYNADSAILTNISSVLFCEEKDIIDFHAINEGITNTSFRFACKNEAYVYRHPGAGTDAYIHRDSEAYSMRMAKELGLDDSFLYMDSKTGWKLSRYVRDARHPDFSDTRDVSLALSLMRRLHNEKLISKYDFDHKQETDRMISLMRGKRASGFSDFHLLYERFDTLYRLAAQDSLPRQFCHNDCYRDNFIIDTNGKGYLIDWEYSGNSDPSSDIATFISCSEYSYSEALDIIREYYEDASLTEQQMRHDIAYVAITSFHWFVWAIYQTTRDKVIGSSLYRWYKNVKVYGDKALRLWQCADSAIIRGMKGQSPWVP